VICDVSSVRDSLIVMKWGPSHKIVRPIVFPFAAQIYSAILHTKQRQPRRAALPISSVDSGQRSVAARRSGASPGLSSGRFVVVATAIYSVYRSDIGYTPSINRRSVLVAPLCFICIRYNWESSDLSGKAEKWSNCEMRTNIMHELGGDERGGEINHYSNQQMTQQTAPKCWGMI
jgi:hypothetical protein